MAIHTDCIVKPRPLPSGEVALRSKDGEGSNKQNKKTRFPRKTPGNRVFCHLAAQRRYFAEVCRRCMARLRAILLW